MEQMQILEDMISTGKKSYATVWDKGIEISDFFRMSME
jgi:hypothetical protein